MFEIYNDQNIEFFIYDPYIKENYVNFTIKIKLYNFCGEHNFCVSIKDLKNFIQRLTVLYKNDSEETKLCDYDSESFIRLKSNEDKTISLFGQFGSEWEDNLWIFKQDFDQTIINLLNINLNKLIEE